MKFVALLCVLVYLAADGKSIPVEQDSRAGQLTKCLVQILSKALYKTDDSPLHPECKNILTTGSGHSTDAKDAQEELKKTGGEDEELIEADKREQLDDERSQEEFPSYVKRRTKDRREEGDDERSQEEFPSFLKRGIKGKREGMDDERSQEEFPSFMKRRMKEKREGVDDERSQEEFPSFMKRRMKEKREGVDDERSQEEFPSFMKRRMKEKREELNDERSQEEFPSFYKRFNKYKREDPDDERSQEEFPQKRYLSLIYKRDNPDEERSQEEFPFYEYKRSRLLTSREKREEPDYDRSQEAFPSYIHKRTYGDEDEEDEEREKRIWKPTHRYHHKKKYHKRSENGDVEEPDYDRSQEDFPSYANKRNYVDGGEEDEEREKRIWKPTHRYHHKKKYHKRSENGDVEEPDYDRSQEDFPSYANKRNFVDGEDEDEERDKRIWKPTHRYHHKKKYHKRSENGDIEEPDYDRSQEDFPSYTNKRSHYKQNEDLANEQSEELDEDIAKRYWKPTHRYHHKKHHHKRGDSLELEDEDELISEDKALKQPSPEEEEEEQIVHEINKKRHPSSSQEEDDELHKGRQSSAEAALRYLTKKKNELEERQLNKGEIYEKRSPWIYRGYYKKSQNAGESADHHPNGKLEEIAKTLRSKRGLLSQEASPEEEMGAAKQELKELEELASVDHQMKEST